MIIGTCIMDTSGQQSTSDTSDKGEKQTDSEFVVHVHVHVP